MQNRQYKKNTRIQVTLLNLMKVDQNCFTMQPLVELFFPEVWSK